MEYTENMIRLSAKKLDIDIKKYNMEQIKMGMASELEHGSINADKNLNVTNDEPTQTLQIVLAHLEEVPDYYTKLKQVEPIEEKYKLHGFDKYISTEIKEDDIVEDGEGGPAIGAASLTAIPGMGAPVLAGRDITGSGDVPIAPKKKKKRKQRVKDFDQFIK